MRCSVAGTLSGMEGWSALGAVYQSAERLAPGQAVSPWAYTDSATVQVTTVSISERSGT